MTHNSHIVTQTGAALEPVPGLANMVINKKYGLSGECKVRV